MKQVFNPFLPLNEYIPDGEPHIFDGRVYHYGSHDKEGGHTFCMQDYVVYSASVNDLKNWRFEGISYKASQDPAYPEKKYMYAPDVVKGNDNNYYLYYCMGGDYGHGGYTGPISVAKSSSPAGPFEYIGHVQYEDGTVMMDYICFDPAALNDDGVIRIYYGTQYDYEEREDFETNPEYIASEMEMFGRTKEQILDYKKRICPVSGNPDSIMGAIMVVLKDDMLTVAEKPHHIIPYEVKGTSFEKHPFFEGSSMRKINGLYYFVYSSWQNHELCYATSKYPDKDFVFGGTIVSNGDVGFNGRQEADKLNMTGTTHGSIIEIEGEYYVFFHRLTHKSDYSRQACAEKIHLDKDGHIAQVEITSCGLNNGPLIANGTYPAPIACNLTNGHMPHGSNTVFAFEFPNVTHMDNQQFIAEIEDNTIIGYKYFSFEGPVKLSLFYRYENKNTKVIFGGPIRIDERAQKYNEAYLKLDTPNIDCGPNRFDIYTDLEKPMIGSIILDCFNEDKKWMSSSIDINITTSTHPLYFVYHGNNKVQLLEFIFSTI